MIDWQIIKDGEYPHNYDCNRDGCWFPDWRYQELLLPHFNTGHILIDEYGRTEFYGAELQRLEANLQWALDRYDAKVAAWSVTVEVIDPAQPAADPPNRTIERVVFERDVIVNLLEKTLHMIQRARAEDASLVFFGD
jgi:hypothetical protein